LILGFKGLGPLSTRYLALEPVARQKGMADESCSHHHSKERQRERGKGSKDKIYSPKACPQRPTSSKRPHFLKALLVRNPSMD
jgi:hypothetical protein